LYKVGAVAAITDYKSLWGIQMDDDRSAFRESWKYRMAVRRFQSAFEAVGELGEAERQLLLERVGNWLLQHMRSVPSKESKTAKVVRVETSQGDVESPSGRDDDPPEVA
jgi:hypothetical protein